MKKTHFFSIISNILSKIPGPFYQFFFIRVVKRAFSLSRRTLPGTLDFLLKKFYLTLFPESARTTIGLLTIFSQRGRQKCRHGVQNTIPKEKVSEKKSFPKFSIRHWGRLFETPGEIFAAGFSKLHFSCHEGSLKQKNFLFKTFLQDFCEFELSKFWNFSSFFREFSRHYIFGVQINFLKGSFHDQLNHRSKNMWINKKTVWDSERISQTSGKIFSTIWSKMLSRSSAEKLSGIFSWKKSFFHCFPNFALTIFRLSPNVSAGLSKLRLRCPEENCEDCSRQRTLFLQIPKIEQTFF